MTEVIMKSFGMIALSVLTLLSTVFCFGAQDTSTTIFDDVRSVLEQVSEDSPQDTVRDLCTLIEKRAVDGDTVRHQYRLSLGSNPKLIEALWSALHLKGREPQHFVEVISDCAILEMYVPFGFVRQPTIELPGVDPFVITERVMLDESTKTEIFVQLEGDFLAINRLECVDGCWNLVLTYVYDHPRTKEDFEDEMILMVEKLLTWSEQQMV